MEDKGNIILYRLCGGDDQFTQNYYSIGVMLKPESEVSCCFAPGLQEKFSYFCEIPYFNEKDYSHRGRNQCSIFY